MDTGSYKRAGRVRCSRSWAFLWAPACSTGPRDLIDAARVTSWDPDDVCCCGYNGSAMRAETLPSLTRNGRCYGATQAGNPGVRRLLDKVRNCTSREWQ